jgi:hypothetical protein
MSHSCSLMLPGLKGGGGEEEGGKWMWEGEGEDDADSTKEWTSLVSMTCKILVQNWKRWLGGRGKLGSSKGTGERAHNLEGEINTYGRSVALRELIVNVTTNNGSLANA